MWSDSESKGLHLVWSDSESKGLHQIWVMSSRPAAPMNRRQMKDKSYHQVEALRLRNQREQRSLEESLQGIDTIGEVSLFFSLCHQLNFDSFMVG